MESKEEKNTDILNKTNTEQLENKDTTKPDIVGEENQGNVEENDSSDENKEENVFVPSTVTFFKSRYLKFNNWVLSILHYLKNEPITILNSK